MNHEMRMGLYDFQMAMANLIDLSQSVLTYPILALMIVVAIFWVIYD